MGRLPALLLGEPALLRAVDTGEVNAAASDPEFVQDNVRIGRRAMRNTPYGQPVQQSEWREPCLAE
jgi:hypothetical protein